MAVGGYILSPNHGKLIPAKNLDDAVEAIRQTGVPIGVLSYNMKEDRIEIALFADVDAQEAEALLQKMGVQYIPTK